MLRMQLEQQWIDEVLKIRGSAAQLPNMDAVDAALAKLLLRSQGEAREAILSHLTRLYYRVAADYPDIVSRWSKLFRDIGVFRGRTSPDIFCRLVERQSTPYLNPWAIR